MEDLEKKFFKKFPIFQPEKFACHVDFGEEERCVWDDNKPEDCSLAYKGISKEKCEYWHKTERNNFCLYQSDEIWAWIKNNVTPN